MCYKLQSSLTHSNLFLQQSSTYFSCLGQCQDSWRKLFNKMKSFWKVNNAVLQLVFAWGNFNRLIGKSPNICKQFYFFFLQKSALITHKAPVIPSFFTMCNRKFTFHRRAVSVKSTRKQYPRRLSVILNISVRLKWAQCFIETFLYYQLFLKSKWQGSFLMKKAIHLIRGRISVAVTPKETRGLRDSMQGTWQKR